LTLSAGAGCEVVRTQFLMHFDGCGLRVRNVESRDRTKAEREACPGKVDMGGSGTGRGASGVSLARMWSCENVRRGRRLRTVLSALALGGGILAGHGLVALTWLGRSRPKRISATPASPSRAAATSRSTAPTSPSRVRERSTFRPRATSSSKGARSRRTDRSRVQITPPLRQNGGLPRGSPRWAYASSGRSESSAAPSGGGRAGQWAAVTGEGRGRRLVERRPAAPGNPNDRFRAPPPRSCRP
jgi:hypothetical protein